MDILGLGSKIDVEFLLDPNDQRKQVDVKSDDSKRLLQYLYYDGEDVAGAVGMPCPANTLFTRRFVQVQLKLKKNSKVEHQGIRLEFIGQIGKSLCRRGTCEETPKLTVIILNRRDAQRSKYRA